ncbi:MAG: FtsX-like permease family protein [Candidatus Latescibacteria bacterium]|nr:FtsX-like permease family protein [Candidatus Latescibacterota bacterium]
MLWNHITVAVRHLWLHRGYTATNVLGLACAMASVLFLCSLVTEELRYVNYHENGHRIFRVLKEVRGDVRTNYSDWVSGGTTVVVREQFPEVIAARAYASHGTREWLRVGDQTLQDFSCRADPQLLEVFGFELMHGQLSTDATTAVITESLARKFFGDADPVGQTITMVESMRDFTITGVLQDIPKYANIRLGLVTAAPRSNYTTRDLQAWEGWLPSLWGPKNYLLLPEGMGPERIEAALNRVLARSLPAEGASKVTLHLQPMDEAHLFGYGPGQWQGRIQDLGFFGMISLILVAVACANFVNLAVARTTARASEIATRKAIGAGWFDIVGQFLTEAVLVTAAATILGAVFASVDPVTSVLGWNPMTLATLTDWYFAASVGALFLVVAVAAGLYPGIVALRLPMRSSGPTASAPTAALRTRNLLIVGQLTCAMFFIASTIVVRQQTFRMASGDLGFASDRVLTTRIVFNNSPLSRREAIKESFRRIPGVAAASTQFPGPGMETIFRTAFRDTDPENGIETQVLGIDSDFLDTFGIELVAGRNVSPGEVDGSEILLNERAVRRFGWGEAGMAGAIGRTLHVADNGTGTVVGVVRDFHYSSLRDRIPPLLLRTWPQLALAVRLEGPNSAATLAAVEATWQQHFEQPIELRPVMDMWGFSLENERFRSQTYGLLSWTAIVLATLGVFGLAAYETERRRREVGVRKALGATAMSIVTLFWRDHVRLVVWATAIAVPLTYKLASEWLQGFAYRIDLTAVPFASAAATVALVFLSVVGVQAARIGRVLPADTLRSE